MRMTEDHWRALDWTRPNREIARATGRSANTVAYMRNRLAMPKATQSAPTKYSPASGDALARHSNRDAWRIGVEATVREWSLRSPDGRHFSARNLRQFVRDHSSEFAEDDLDWKGTGRGGGTCRAVAGLYQSARTGGEWKGWQASQD